MPPLGLRLIEKTTAFKIFESFFVEIIQYVEVEFYFEKHFFVSQYQIKLQVDLSFVYFRRIILIFQCLKFFTLSSDFSCFRFSADA